MGMTFCPEQCHSPTKTPKRENLLSKNSARGPDESYFDMEATWREELFSTRLIRAGPALVCICRLKPAFDYHSSKSAREK
ncbi:hypothetical protein E2P81_ATG10954 [Venturia nashicola]|uniref:Uncharacterized protein n=1 Tax=Venturia nashicola TaxID=86259 RepID=A0A4Z1P2B2_9PEZI|nr:hypothetical protein E6O75_ATG10629 [Venturia nashicola]TLD27666.1 hypothetical protein E2P81_ATG10954 [Venturia nashicola]